MKRWMLFVLMLVAGIAVLGCKKDDASTPVTPAAPAPAGPTYLVNYSSNCTTICGDGIDRGFYVESMPATTFSKVRLWLGTSSSGAKVIQLTARKNTYDGEVIGVASAAVSLTASATNVPVDFTFSAAPVTVGSVVTFSMTLLTGTANVYYSLSSDFGGLAPGDINVTETTGTTPPLDTFRHNGVAVQIW